MLPNFGVGPWNESYDCTVCGAGSVGAFTCSVCPISTTVVAIRERIWNESRTDISVNDGEGQLSCVGVWF